MLTGSGVDEAWTTGSQLAEAVLELLKAGKPLSRENLEATYVVRRRASWVEEEGKVAEKARDGFHRGMIPGLLGMAIAGFTDGKHSLSGEPKLMPSPEEYYREKIPAAELTKIMEDCRARGVGCHNALMDRVGWPAIPYDGQLLVSHQDALLMGGKVQAAPGYRGPCTLRIPGFLRELCRQDVHRNVFRPGHHRGRCRNSGLRSRKVHPLWRLHLELRRPTG